MTSILLSLNEAAHSFCPLPFKLHVATNRLTGKNASKLYGVKYPRYNNEIEKSFPTEKNFVAPTHEEMKSWFVTRMMEMYKSKGLTDEEANAILTEEVVEHGTRIWNLMEEEQIEIEKQSAPAIWAFSIYDVILSGVWIWLYL